MDPSEEVSSRLQSELGRKSLLEHVTSCPSRGELFRMHEAVLGTALSRTRIAAGTTPSGGPGSSTPEQEADVVQSLAQTLYVGMARLSQSPANAVAAAAGVGLPRFYAIWYKTSDVLWKLRARAHVWKLALPALADEASCRRDAGVDVTVSSTASSSSSTTGSPSSLSLAELKLVLACRMAEHLPDAKSAESLGVAMVRLAGIMLEVGGFRTVSADARWAALFRCCRAALSASEAAENDLVLATVDAVPRSCETAAQQQARFLQEKGWLRLCRRLIEKDRSMAAVVVAECFDVVDGAQWILQANGETIVEEEDPSVQLLLCWSALKSGAIIPVFTKKKFHGSSQRGLSRLADAVRRSVANATELRDRLKADGGIDERSPSWPIFNQFVALLTDLSTALSSSSPGNGQSSEHDKERSTLDACLCEFSLLVCRFLPAVPQLAISHFLAGRQHARAWALVLQRLRWRLRERDNYLCEPGQRQTVIESYVSVLEQFARAHHLSTSMPEIVPESFGVAYKLLLAATTTSSDQHDLDGTPDSTPPTRPPDEFLLKVFHCIEHLVVGCSNEETRGRSLVQALCERKLPFLTFSPDGNKSCWELAWRQDDDSLARIVDQSLFSSELSLVSAGKKFLRRDHDTVAPRPAKLTNLNPN